MGETMFFDPGSHIGHGIDAADTHAHMSGGDGFHCCAHPDGICSKQMHDPQKIDHILDIVAFTKVDSSLHHHQIFDF